MSEPYIGRLKPAEFNRIKQSLQQKGVTVGGATEFLSGRPVSNNADRLKLAAILISHEGPRPGLR